MERRGRQGGQAYSGTNYDVWSYQEAARTGGLHTDTPLSRMQRQYWVTKQQVVGRLGREQDQHVVASDQQLDAKLELFRSIQETTGRLQRLTEAYQDRLCLLAAEENALGRFLKEHGKADSSRAGKMMVAAGKTLSYTGQQRLAIRVPLVRLYQEVDTFRQRAIQDTRWTVEAMEKARTEYRGALLWMKNVSTELDPDTFKQLEKFRKVQANVKSSKRKFDKLGLDCLQKVDLLAASRCNMFSHALIMYQNTLVTFWDKTSKTMNHVNKGFQGYQYYEFNYIKDLAGPSRQLAASAPTKPAAAGQEAGQEAGKAAGQLVELGGEQQQRSGSLHNLLDLESDKPPTLDEDDEILLRIDQELEGGEGGEGGGGLLLGQECGQLTAADQSVGDLLGGDSAALLADLLSSTPDTTQRSEPDSFTTQWEAVFPGGDGEAVPGEAVAQLERSNSLTSQSFLPSQLFQAGPTPPGPVAGAAAGRARDMNEWFSLFAELDPLANPDAVTGAGQNTGGC